jgi:hypothetical protein
MAAINPTLSSFVVTPEIFQMSAPVTITGTLSGAAGVPAGAVQLQLVTGASQSTIVNIGSSITLDGTGSFSWSGVLPNAAFYFKVVFTTSNSATYNTLTAIASTSCQYVTTTTTIQSDVRYLTLQQTTGNIPIIATVQIAPNQYAVQRANSMGEMALWCNGQLVGRSVGTYNSGSSFPNLPSLLMHCHFTVPGSMLKAGANTLTALYSGGGFYNILSYAPSSATQTLTLLVPQTYSFNLASAASATTATVSNSSGKQIRTIWAGKAMTSGTHNVDWDGLDDFGNPAPADTYTVQVLYGNPAITWQGVVGNTSYDVGTATPNFTGTNVWDANGSWPKDCFITAGRAFFAGAYAELRPNAFVANMTALNSPAIMLPYVDQARQLNYVASDGTNVYFANTGGGWSTAPYTQMAFSSGSNPGVGTVPYTGVIDVGTVNGDGTLTNIATGIAVQSGGTVLAVSHGSFWTVAATQVASSDTVKLFNKVTGASMGTITVSNPQRCAFDTSNNLWVINGGSNAYYGTQVTQYTNLSTSPAAGITLSGLVQPIAIACDPSTGDVVVVDGGTSQQVKRFSSSTGALISTINNVWVSVAADSSVLFSDAGNLRMMHFSSTGTYLNRVSFLPSNTMYYLAIDKQNPNALFMKFLEYTLDFTKTLTAGDPDPALGGNGCWALTRNWSVALPSTTYSFFTSVCTLSNGTTYALANYGQSATLAYGALPIHPQNYNATQELLVLNQTAGTITRSGIQTYSGYAAFNNNNEVAVWASASVTVNSTLYTKATITAQAITGFSGGYPTLGAATVVATSVVPNPVSFVATISGGAVTGFTSSKPTVDGIPNGTYPLTLAGGGGTGAIINMVVSGAVQATSGIGFINGTVTAQVVNGGTGYTTAPTISGQPQYGYPFQQGGWGGIAQADLSTSGYYAFCAPNPAYYSPSYHLTGVKRGQTNATAGLATHSWYGCPSGNVFIPDGMGTFSNQSAFGGHNGQQCLVAGGYIIMTYDGQYGVYGNQYFVYTEDGLFVAQFGVSVGATAAAWVGGPAVAGYAGNIGRFIAAVVSGTLYLFSSDEGEHAGFHMWTVSNLSSLGRAIAMPVQPTIGVAQ